MAGPERLSLGLPGDRPQGFGALASVPTRGKSAAKLFRTRVGAARTASKSSKSASARRVKQPCNDSRNARRPFMPAPFPEALLKP